MRPTEKSLIAYYKKSALLGGGDVIGRLLCKLGLHRKRMTKSYTFGPLDDHKTGYYPIYTCKRLECRYRKGGKHVRLPHPYWEGM